MIRGSQSRHCDEAISSVGSYPAGASPYGDFDRAVNVSGRVIDWYSQGTYNGSLEENHTGPGKGTLKVNPGGSRSRYFHRIRVADRQRHVPTYRSDHISFRCVVDSASSP